MKTKFFAALALAAALFIGQPAFAAGHKGGGAKHGGGGGHAVAAVHRGGGGKTHAVAFHAGGGHMRTFAARGGGGFRPARVATVRTAPAPGATAFAQTRVRGTTAPLAANRGNTFARGSRPGVAFGGNSYNAGRGTNGRGTYAFASRDGWNHDQEYSWHGHHYHWYNNGWFIIDANPYVYSNPGYYGPGDYNADTIGVQVQQDLAHDGYYNGPVDGVVGPRTRAAIAAYQQDNGLPVTGAIDQGLLNSLNGS